MEIVDKSGASQNMINQSVYKSMKEKLSKFELVLHNISEEIKETSSSIQQKQEDLIVHPTDKF